MKVVKILAAILGSVIALLVLAAILIATFFDPNDYKDYLTDWVEDQTGRSLVIEDDLELAFFPWLAVETGGVTVGNAVGFEERPFAVIDRLSARVRLIPLLSREIDLGTIQIDGLQLNLSSTSDGRNNWQDLLASGTSSEPTARSEPAESSAIGSLDVEGILLRGASLTWRTDNDETRYVISDINLETSSINPSRPTEIELSLAALDVKTQRTGQLEVDATVMLGADGAIEFRDVSAMTTVGDARGNDRATVTVELDEARYTAAGMADVGSTSIEGELFEPPIGAGNLPFRIEWQSASIDSSSFDFTVDGLRSSFAGIDADWRVSGRAAADSPDISGSVSIADASIGSLLSLLEIAPPPGASLDDLGKFALSTTFNVGPEPGRASVGNLIVDVLGTSLRTGSAVVADGRLETAISVAPFRPNETLKRIIAANVPEEIDTDSIERLSFSGTLSAELPGDTVQIRDIRAEMLGGTISGTLNASSAAEGRLISGSIRTDRFDPSELLAVMGGLVEGDVDADAIGNVMLRTDFSFDTEADSVILSSTRVEAYGLGINAEVRATEVSASPRLRGRAEVEEFRPRALIARFGQSPPQSSDETALRSASIAAQFDLSQSLGRFEDLVVMIDQTRITGNFDVDDFSDPSYRFSLAIDSLNVDRYLPPQSEDADPGERRAGDLEIQAEPLTALVMNGRFSVGELRIAGLDFQSVSANISVGGGSMLIDSAHTDLYGGVFDGGFRVETANGLPSLSFDGVAQRVALAPLITALTGDSSYSGMADFDVSLTGTGGTVTENLHSAAGTMGFSLRDGAIDGFNIEHTLCRYYNNLRQLPGPTNDVPERTPFALIQGKATVENGIASSNDLLARSGSIQVRGNGRLSLPDQVADYRFEAQFSESVHIAGCETMDRMVGIDFPLTLSGPVTAPDIRPDYSEIFERWAKDEIEDRVRDRLEERLLDILN